MKFFVWFIGIWFGASCLLMAHYAGRHHQITCDELLDGRQGTCFPQED